MGSLVRQCTKLRSCISLLALGRASVTLPFTSSALTAYSAGNNRELVEARPFKDLPSQKNFLNIAWDLAWDPTTVVEVTEKRVKRLGKVFKEKYSPNLPEMVIAVDPEDIETVFRTGDRGYPRRFTITEWTKVRDELQLPYGMLLENEDKWLKQRVPISKYIMMPRKMEQYSVPFNDVSLDLVGLIRRRREEGDVVTDTLAVMNKWAFESVSLFVLGKRMGCLEDTVPPDCQEFISCVQGFVTTTSDIMMTLPFYKSQVNKLWNKLLEQIKYIYEYASELIQEKIEEIERHASEGKDNEEQGDDFLSHMVCSGKMDVKEIAVNAIDLLAAGIDTTSVTLASCLYQLAINQEVQEKLRREVQEVVGEESRVTPEHVQNMHYLRDCIKETQRMYPIAPSNGRILTEDVVLSGYRIPAGVPIIMATAVAGRLPDNFPEPDKFKPERWSRDSDAPPNPFASLPFGFGRRMCVGRRVAELEMHIVLAQLIRNFKIDCQDDKSVRFIVKLFYYPKQNISLVFNDI